LILIGKFLLREKMAKHAIAAQSGVLGASEAIEPAAGPMFCTSFVDKIVRKHFEYPAER
jgi:hypothetical protein